MSTERQKAIQKVAKLLNMTSDKGASENEAVQAAEKAAELMELFNINMTEVQLKNLRSIQMDAESTIYHNNWKLGDHDIARHIARLCDCLYWHKSKTTKFVFFGLPSDVEFAVYLYEMLSHTILVELEAYKQSGTFKILSQDQNKITIYRAFIRGMQDRLAERIVIMAINKETNVERELETTGRNLVVVKIDQIKSEFEDCGIKLRFQRQYSRHIDSDAQGHGRDAAEKINLERSLNNTKQGALT